MMKMVPGTPKRLEHRVRDHERDVAPHAHLHERLREDPRLGHARKDAEAVRDREADDHERHEGDARGSDARHWPRIGLTAWRTSRCARLSGQIARRERDVTA
ncbi:MAG: hypothetical protein U0235_00895 [Polyangiaceae bacterium]